MHESHRGHKLGPGVSRPVVILQYSVCQEWDVAVARSQWRECLQEALILWKPWRYFDISKLLYGSNRKVCPVEMVSINLVFILQSCSWFIGFAWYSWFYAISWERVPVTREFMSELKNAVSFLILVTRLSYRQKNMPSSTDSGYLIVPLLGTQVLILRSYCTSLS